MCVWVYGACHVLLFSASIAFQFVYSISGHKCSVSEACFSSSQFLPSCNYRARAGRSRGCWHSSSSQGWLTIISLYTAVAANLWRVMCVCVRVCKKRWKCNFSSEFGLKSTNQFIYRPFVCRGGGQHIPQWVAPFSFTADRLEYSTQGIGLSSTGQLSLSLSLCTAKKHFNNCSFVHWCEAKCVWIFCRIHLIFFTGFMWGFQFHSVSQASTFLLYVLHGSFFLY